MLLAGLFTEEDMLPEESVNDLIGPPMPVVVPVRPAAPEPQPPLAGESQQEEAPLPAAASATPVPEEAPPAEAQHPARRQQSTQERIRKHADACTMQAVKQKSDLIKRMWSNTNATKEVATAWTNAVRQATASYGWHVINDFNANPAKSSDDTRPMLTYAIAWIMGYVAGFHGEEPTERMLQEASQRTGISLGETGQQVMYAQNLCLSKGYGPECRVSLIRHTKHMFLTHDPRNPDAADMPDATTYNWIADIDGYADGWFVGRQVRAQQQRA